MRRTRGCLASASALKAHMPAPSPKPWHNTSVRSGSGKPGKPAAAGAADDADADAFAVACAVACAVECAAKVSVGGKRGSGEPRESQSDVGSERVVTRTAPAPEPESSPAPAAPAALMALAPVAAPCGVSVTADAGAGATPGAAGGGSYRLQSLGQAAASKSAYAMPATRPVVYGVAVIESANRESSASSAMGRGGRAALGGGAVVLWESEALVDDVAVALPVAKAAAGTASARAKDNGRLAANWRTLTVIVRACEEKARWAGRSSVRNRGRTCTRKCVVARATTRRAVNIGGGSGLRSLMQQIRRN